MKPSKQIQWLYEELPKLTQAGVVPAEVAEKLRQHYGAAECGGRRWAIVLFGILGGALIGAGIILLLAHNWDELSRPVRAVISFLPLVIAVALAAFVIWKRAGSTAWSESVGIFWALAIGATISLVAQTYHISGDFPAFILTWSLAGLPIVYLLNCSSAALLFWVGATVWAGHACWNRDEAMWFWPLAALAVPHLWLVARTNRYRPRVAMLIWGLAGCAAFGIGFGLTHRIEHAWIPVFTSYFAVLYMIGSRWFDEGRTFWQRPLQTIGALGVIALGVALTFGDAWRGTFRQGDWPGLFQSPLVVLPVAAVVLWVYTWTRQDPVALLFGGLPVVGMIGTALAAGHAGVVVLVLMNVYVLGLGVALITLGVRDQRLGVVNLGMLVTSVLIIARFFDSDMGFVLRGLAFIAVGIGFLVTNVMLIRRKGGAQ
ncbi:MAG: DUF2157 domain-containing protein [Verrucomicrobiota bacterium]